MEETPLVDAEYLLQKFPGKGGWTFAEIPEVAQNPKNPFGWVKIRGWIDDYELQHYKLMPMGKGKLFLPVKAAIRKQIKKEAGDSVHIKIWLDERPLDIPVEIVECFKTEPQKVYEHFLALTEGQQKTYLDWIYEAKTEETKASRIVDMMTDLSRSKTQDPRSSSK